MSAATAHAPHRKLLTSKLALSGLLLFSIFASAQNPTDSTQTKPVALDDVMVSAIRADAKTPVTFSNVSKTEIEKRNLGQDIPQLLNFLPSVVTTSDAGNGFGYTGIRVRGSDATRVNVTINGVPYNDSESSGTYFVDIPDFASSLQSIQLQRGVGTSTNGAGAFGASLNLLTGAVSEKAHAEIGASYGTFNSRKNSVSFSTGKINGNIEIAGRLAVLHSDGYIDRATSDLKSYFLQGTYLGKSTTIRALAFGGYERTYQAWNGIDKETLETDPRFNPSGMYTDASGNVRFYGNEVDDYRQDHFQLHWNERISAAWQTNLALHYTKGKGYYENYKEDADFSEYGLTPLILADTTIASTDLVRRKWLDNDFYGLTFSAQYQRGKLGLIVGGAANNYEGAHYGEVVWARFASASEPGDHYYDQNAVKTDANGFAKLTWQIAAKWRLFGDLQYRYVGYRTSLDSGKRVDDAFHFFNPKAGATFSANDKNDIYLSYARANKEPTRTDYENGTPRPESLDDVELGWRFHNGHYAVNANFYLMHYRDQLVKTGELDDVGNEINANVGKSYRAGIELDAQVKADKFTLSPNVSLSRNKILDYTIATADGIRNFGDTDISFSPAVTVGMQMAYDPLENLHLALLSKYVGEQYAGNFEGAATRLGSYATTDFNVVYTVKPKSVFSSIVFTGLVNNIFDRHYVSNAYLYGEDYLSYFPQAGINVLGGLTLKF